MSSYRHDCVTSIMDFTQSGNDPSSFSAESKMLDWSH